MKRIVATTLIVFALAVPTYASSSFGSAFGTLTTARSIGMGEGTFGFGVGIADATSFVSWLKYGLANYLDGRVKIGLVDADWSDTRITIGADLMYQLLDASPASNDPFDLSLGGFMEYADYSGTLFQIGGAAVGSYEFMMKSGQTLTPYARFNMRIESYSSDYYDNSDLELGLNGGVQWGITKTVKGYGEFQLDGNDGVFFGLELSVF